MYSAFPLQYRPRVLVLGVCTVYTRGEGAERRGKDQTSVLRWTCACVCVLQAKIGRTDVDSGKESANGVDGGRHADVTGLLN